MNVLVTGGAGYIGSVTVAELLRRGHRVRVVDRLLFGGESLLGAYNTPYFDFVRGDIRDRGTLSDALDGEVDAVVHLAAIVGDPACASQPEEARQVNYEATLGLVDLCRERGISRFVFVSTCSNYGISDPSQPATEESPLNPVSLYAETKVGSERYILQAADDEFRPCILRLATVFGLSPRMRFDLLVNEFTRDALLHRKLVVYGEQFWRPYVHVQDVAEAIVTVLASPTSLIAGQVFNVGSDSENYQKRQLVELVLQQIPGTQVETVPKGDDPRSYRVSFAKIARILGFRPRWRVPDGIAQVKRALEQGVFDDPFSTRYRNTRA
ncbi:MAG: NAD(P)-dependent oxidoreductase [Chloroflexi bacterium]|nr:NAD(P)-dependent oxidoreductase [Chloroflexota bacterium]